MKLTNKLMLAYNGRRGSSIAISPSASFVNVTASEIRNWTLLGRKWVRLPSGEVKLTKFKCLEIQYKNLYGQLMFFVVYPQSPPS